MSKTSLAADIIKKITLIYDDKEYVGLINSLLSVSKPTILSFVNAHAVNLSFTNNDFANALLSSDVIVRDGIGMKLFYKVVGKDAGCNMVGTDFIPELLKHSLDKKIAVYGTQNPYLAIAINKLKAEGHNIVSVYDGFADQEMYLKLSQITQPELIMLAMGMPKQENVSLHLRNNLEHPCTIVNGGAIVDFMGGKVRRAPLWIRKLGMEWFYRFLNEPRRLFKRYIVGNFVFFIHILKLKKHVSN